MSTLIPAISRITEGAVKISSRYASWRMVHDGTNLIVYPFASDGETGTPGILFEAPTLNDCITEIAALGLVVSEDSQKRILKLSEDDILPFLN